MKTKIKRHSRSVLSVVLALCMLVSCMTAGMIMTDAAKVDSELVGDTTYVYVPGSFNSWNTSDSSYSLSSTDGNHYTGSFTVSGSSSYTFKLYYDSNYYGNGGSFTNSSGTTQTGLSTSGGNMTLSIGDSGSYLVSLDYYKEYDNQTRLTITWSSADYYLWVSNSDSGLSSTSTKYKMNGSDPYTYTLPAGTYYININHSSSANTQSTLISSVSKSGNVTTDGPKAWSGWNHVYIKSSGEISLSFSNGVLSVTGSGSSDTTYYYKGTTDGWAGTQMTETSTSGVYSVSVKFTSTDNVFKFYDSTNTWYGHGSAGYSISTDEWGSSLSSPGADINAPGAGTYTLYFRPSDLKAYAVKDNTYYTITCNSAENGTLSSSAASATDGSTVTITATPASGYTLKKLVVILIPN